MKFSQVLLVSALTYFSNNAVVTGFSVIPSSSRTTPMLFAAESVAEAPSTTLGGAGVSGLTSGLTTVFTSEQIDAILPHRYPFALVDKVVEYEAGKRAVGIKSVTKVC